MQGNAYLSQTLRTADLMQGRCTRNANACTRNAHVDPMGPRGISNELSTHETLLELSVEV